MDGSSEGGMLYFDLGVTIYERKKVKLTYNQIRNIPRQKSKMLDGIAYNRWNNFD